MEESRSERNPLPAADEFRCNAGAPARVFEGSPVADDRQVMLQIEARPNRRCGSAAARPCQAARPRHRPAHAGLSGQRTLLTRRRTIHHSDRFHEIDSNWSSLLSVWDYLHGTMLLSVPQDEITIGVPAYHDPAT